MNEEHNKGDARVDVAPNTAIEVAEGCAADPEDDVLVRGELPESSGIEADEK